jgi:long-subunit fatty acid transport protein
MTIGLGAHPVHWLVIDADTHIGLWDSIQSLTLTLTDPKAPKGTPPTKQSQELDFRTTFGIRLGFELRLLEQDKLRVRFGGGYDRTPHPQSTLNPLAPDADRGVMSAGVAYWFGAIGLEASYMIVLLPDRTSHLVDFPATYDSMGHVISVGVQLRLDELGGRINEPEFK